MLEALGRWQRVRVPRLRPAVGLLDRIGDLVSDLAVWAFATWTVLYHLGRVLGLGTTVILAFSVLATLLLALVTWRHLDGAPEDRVSDGIPLGGTRPGGEPDRGSGTSTGPAATSWRPFALSVALTVASMVLHWLREPGLYAVAWLLMAAALLPLVWTLAGPTGEEDAHSLRRRQGRPGTHRRRGRVEGRGREWMSAAVWLVAFVMAYLSLRTVRLDADDVFYVNKAVFVAETGRIDPRHDLQRPGPPGAAGERAPRRSSPSRCSRAPSLTPSGCRRARWSTSSPRPS